MREHIRHARPMLSAKDVKKANGIQERLDQAHKKFSTHLDRHECWEPKGEAREAT